MMVPKEAKWLAHTFLRYVSLAFPFPFPTSSLLLPCYEKNLRKEKNRIYHTDCTRPESMILAQSFGEQEPLVAFIFSLIVNTRLWYAMGRLFI